MSGQKGRRARPILDLSPHRLNGTLVAFNIGHDGTPFVVYAEEPCNTRPSAPWTYRVLAFRDGEPVLDSRVENARFHVRDIQPLGDHILLLCSEEGSETENSGRIHGCDGRLRAEVALGEGINTIQTTSRGLIWSAYGDEVTCSGSPLGRSGLAARTAAGKALYEFEPRDGLDHIVDCYALNVASDDVWCYYYPSFPLVHIRDFEVVEFWKAPVTGSHAFAVDSGYALFLGGYHNWSHELVLCSLRPDREPEVVAKFWVADENHQALHTDQVVGRGGSYLLRDTIVYRLDISDVLDAAPQ